MGNSLQEQLLKAGLVDAKQARKAQSGKGKRRSRKGQAAPQPDEAAAAAERARAEKAARDRALNAERKAAAERTALEAQVRQLVEQSRVSLEDGDEPYHFVDAGKVRTLQVSSAVRRQLAQGRMAIVRCGGRYDVVPEPAAQKIATRDPGCVVPRPTPDAEPAPGDPYAAYQVPDDLMW